MDAPDASAPSQYVFRGVARRRRSTPSWALECSAYAGYGLLTWSIERALRARTLESDRTSQRYRSGSAGSRLSSEGLSSFGFLYVNQCLVAEHRLVAAFK